MHIDFLAASTYKWMTNVFGVGIGFMTKNLLDKIQPNVVGLVGIEDRNKDFAKMTFKNNPGAQRFETGGLNWLGLLGLEIATKDSIRIGIHFYNNKDDIVTLLNFFGIIKKVEKFEYVKNICKKVIIWNLNMKKNKSARQL